MGIEREPESAGSRSFLPACILLLVREQATHGYGLLERLAQFGFDAADSGWVYRTLRGLEESEMVASCWETSHAGPARRMYQITEQGERFLDARVGALRASKRTIERFLEQYAGGGSPRAARGRPSPSTIDRRRGRQANGKDQRHGDGTEAGVAMEAGHDGNR